MTSLVEIRSAVLQGLRPPPRVALSQWIETIIDLPQG
jgi:hypothetical protein